MKILLRRLLGLSSLGLISLSVLVFFSPSLLAAGAILVDTSQTGLATTFENGFVGYNPESAGDDPESGRLGRLSNEEARDLVAELFQDWAQVSIEGLNTVALVITEGDGLGNVDVSNIDQIFTYCPPGSTCPDDFSPLVTGSAGSGQNPIIFDADGSLTDLIQGEGAGNDILGFAGPRVVERGQDGRLYIKESQAVLNGKFIDCAEGAASSDACQSPETSLENYKGAIFHELGHFLGLDHVQVNLSSASKALNGDPSELAAIPTMLPLFIDGEAQLSPHLDDKVSLSMLYPSDSFESSFCTLTGTVYASDGSSPIQGVNVIARNPDNPLEEAISFVSGAFYTGSYDDCQAPAGDYEIHGLRPGVSYTLEFEKINPAFTGGSSVEPCQTPASGFNAAILGDVFSCSSGGAVITNGASGSTKIVTTKESQTIAEDSGGCSLILD